MCDVEVAFDMFGGKICGARGENRGIRRKINDELALEGELNIGLFGGSSVM